jgi:hypothetical protein
MRVYGENQGRSGRLIASASSLIPAETREHARLPFFAGNQGRGTTAADRPTVDITEMPENLRDATRRRPQSWFCGSALLCWRPLTTARVAKLIAQAPI